MVTIARPDTLTQPARYGAMQGLVSWLTTVDAKRIGILYGGSAFAFFLIGGIEAMLMRIQLAQPNEHVISPDMFNQLFTMHGTTMIFLVIMPLNAAFFNYIVPLMIGARDVAFPRLNAFSFWIFLAGGLLMNASFFLGGAPNVGWFAYANLTEPTFSPGHGVDFWLLGLQMLGFSSLAAAFNFMITIINMRAPGMRFLRMPLLVWMTLVTTFLLILAFPILTAALVELMFDRFFNTNFFNTVAGANPLLWVNLFWIFGHPEVYILIIPAMGVISEIMATFSRKPLFGYPVVVFSGVSIAFMGFGVWAHHMFSVGLGPIADSVFAIFTMMIAIPTGIKVFNWIGTLWNGSLNVKSPLLYALGFISMFIVGGISGIMHATPPPDLQQHGTYFVVAHLHYVLYGGSIFGLFAGIHYWFPKFSGRMLDEKLAQITFWVMFFGFNVTFFPMHFTGLQGMPRRVYTYTAALGVSDLNLVSTIGSFILFASVAMFTWNLWTSLRQGKLAPWDPWDGATLEWATSSPPPEYNFAVIPTVLGREAFWQLKYPEWRGAGRASPESLGMVPVIGGAGTATDAVALQSQPPVQIHMPRPSWFPLIVAVGILFLLIGVIYTFVLSGIGLLVMLYGVYSWVFEPPPGPPALVPAVEAARVSFIPGHVPSWIHESPEER
jgi:cytochrome c oxidase subunit I